MWALLECSKPRDDLILVLQKFFFGFLPEMLLDPAVSAPPSLASRNPLMVHVASQVTGLDLGGACWGCNPPQNIKDHTHTPLQKFSAVLVCTKPMITQ